jgi:hypothetical protein
MEDATGHPRGLPPVAFYWVENQRLGEPRKQASISCAVSATIELYLSIDIYVQYGALCLLWGLWV